MKAFSIGLRAFCAVVVLGLWSSATAAPVTLAFEAEVTFVAEHAPFNTGIEVGVGDTLSGTVSFLPDAGDGGDFLDVIQTAAVAQFVVDDKVFTTTAGDGIRFRVGNNQPISDGPAGLFDSIQFGAGFSQLPDEPSVGITQAGWGINLSGPARLIIGVPVPDTGLPLPSAMIPSDVASWNLLASTPQSPFGSQMSISLSDGIGGSVSIGARIKEFSQVPEPSTWLIVFTFSAILLLRR